MKNLFKVTFAVAAITFATSCSSSKTEETVISDSTMVVTEDPTMDSTATVTTDSVHTETTTTEEHK